MSSDREKSKLVGINHVALTVGDIEAALDFYGKLFEFELRGRHENMAFIDMGDQFIALGEAAPDEPDEHRHFGLVVDDRELLRDRLRNLDVEIVDSPGLDFLDPWGNRIQVVEYTEIQFTKAQKILEGMDLDHLKKTEAALDELREKGLIE